jgi:SAM-dependent methyltransferase
MTPVNYATHARFVSDLGEFLIDWLAPQPGERILDLGCGDGALTAKLAATGADVVAVDYSEAMVEKTRSLGIDARAMDATELTFSQEFDGVLTNAVLHWIPRADDVVAGVARLLKPGGRFVGEFGGFMNIAALATAVRAVLIRHGRRLEDVWTWYFPTPDEYGAVLEAHGFSVDEIALVPRPTPIRTGIDGWLETFGQRFHLTPVERVEIADLLRPALCDRAGNWVMDYVRLRFRARLTG